MQRFILLLSLLAGSAVAHAASATWQPRVLDDFDNPALWHVSASDDARASLRATDGPHGKALCLDFDLHGTAGYASMRRALPLTFPPNYAFDLSMRGEAPANALQFKLVDASGANVWWHSWRDFVAPQHWKTFEITRQQIDFAWGPRKDHTLRQSAMLELTVAAGSGGGHGSVCFDHLDLHELPVAHSAGKPRAPALATDPNAWFQAAAERAPRGFYPRAFSGEQSYWSVVGIDGGSDSGLLSEDGALEIGKGGFSIEPFLLDDGRLVTWADVTIAHSLRDGYLPIPSVTWRHDGLVLRTTAFGAGTRAQSQLVARYDVRNDSNRARDVTFALTVRPFQVDPSTQFLNAPGGVSPIHHLAWNDKALMVDGRLRALLLGIPDAAGASSRGAGSIVKRLATHHWPKVSSVDDRAGFASGAALYRLHLRAHGSATIGVLVPLTGTAAAAPVIAGDGVTGWLDQEEDAVAARWHGELDHVGLRLPPAQQHLADTLRSSLAWILISRDGPELRPGTRSYDRSWIRDGAMMADALLRMGQTGAARDYALWYAPHQFSTGKVPCCVDARGADPTPENDSPGELIHLIAQVYRYTGDRAFLQTLWPHVTATVAYLHRLTESQSGAQCHEPRTRMFCGLLPASISHEGYSAKPEHSYWDDFWALLGYKDAVAIAQALGRKEDAARLTRQRDQFRADLYASLRTSVAAHHIDFIPGSAELGDFDPTSTTIALTPGGELTDLRRDLPPTLLHDTFERYWRESRARANGDKDWDAYTPYEWRNVGVFARLGWRSRIPVLLDFFFAGQRPQGWNQWAEVVGRDARKPRFIGDMPHAWVASDCIRSLLDLFAFERDGDHSIVLAAGVQPQWLDDGGIAIGNLRTPYGPLGYSLGRDAARLVLRVDKATALPPGGLVLTWPLPGVPGHTTINGKSAHWEQGELRIHAVPAQVLVELDEKKPVAVAR